MLALSTTILPEESISVDETVRRLLDPGVESLILGPEIEPSSVSWVGREIAASGVPIIALRFPCPGPKQVRTGHPSLFALDPQEREEAVDEALATLDTAARFAVPTVIVAPGSLPISDCSPRLAQLTDLGEGAGLEANSLRKELDARTEEVLGGAWDQLRFSLDGLLERCARLEIELAIGNPEPSNGFPRLQDWPALRGEFQGAPLSLWFDPIHHLLRQQFDLDGAADPDLLQQLKISGGDVKDLGKNRGVVLAGDGEIDLEAALAPLPARSPRAPYFPRGCPQKGVIRICGYLRQAHLDGEAPPAASDPFPIIGSPSGS